MITTLNRPLIDFKFGVITHDGIPCRVVMTKDKISIGCSDITPEAMRYISTIYGEKFPAMEISYVIQEGI